MITDVHVIGDGPALISLHGLNGTYDNSATLVSDIKGGLVFPFKVIAPQLGDTDWGKDDIGYVFKYVRSLGITEAHLTGVSLGGLGVIRAMCFNELFPEDTKLKILSVGVVCGKDDKRNFQAYSKYKIKCWHAPDDPQMTIGSIRTMCSEVALLGGDIEILELPVGTKHNAWNYAYNENAEGNYFDWVTDLVSPPTEPIREDILDQYIKDGMLYTITSYGTYTTQVTKE